MKYVLAPSVAIKWVLLPRAMHISSQQRIGVYDCLYVALAEREKCKVLTADQRVVAPFPAQSISLDSLP
jgi:predicted nucleic acid-binding protein